MAAAATRAHAVRATDGGAEQRLRGARDGRRGGAATAPAVAAPSVPETCALVQGACQEGGKRGGAGRAAAAASSRALRAQWGGRARAQRVTGQGSSPHPAVAFERRLSHACAGAAGRSAVGRDGAVPAAGRVQGAGAENPAHSAPAEAADRVESFSWPRGPHLCDTPGGRGSQKWLRGPLPGGRGTASGTSSVATAARRAEARRCWRWWFEVGIVQSSADESRASAGHLLGCTFVSKREIYLLQGNLAFGGAAEST